MNAATPRPAALARSDEAASVELVRRRRTDELQEDVLARRADLLERRQLDAARHDDREDRLGRRCGIRDGDPDLPAGDPSPEIGGVEPDLDAGDPGRPGRRTREPGEDPDRRRLAGSVRAQEAEHRPARNLQVEPVEREDRAVVLRQALVIRPSWIARIGTRSATICSGLRSAIRAETSGRRLGFACATAPMGAVGRNPAARLGRLPVPADPRPGGSPSNRRSVTQ